MGGFGHTPVLWAGLLALGTACSFDASAPFVSSGADAGLATTDAAAAPDADRELSADAGNTVVPMGTLTSSPLDGAITLDGELDAQWLALTFRTYNIGDSQQLEAVGNYVPDASIRFASLYDDNKVYFFFQVFDDLLVDDSTNIYNDDSVEIYLDGLHDSSGPYANDDHWLIISAAGTYQSFGPTSIEPSGVINTTDAGYNIEISLDRSDIGAGSAQEFGFNLGLNDDDGAGNTDVDAYGLWFVPDTATCEDCCADQQENYAWCDTTRLGQLELLP